MFSRKEREEIYIIASVQIAMSTWIFCLAIACIMQAISVFTAAVKIRTQWAFNIDEGHCPKHLYVLNSWHLKSFLIYIRTQEPGFDPWLLWTLPFFQAKIDFFLSFLFHFLENKLQTSILKGVWREKSSHGLKSSLTLVLHQAIQLPVLTETVSYKFWPVLDWSSSVIFTIK